MGIEKEPLPRDLTAKIIDHFPGGFIAVLDQTLLIHKIWGRGLDKLGVNSNDLEGQRLTNLSLFSIVAELLTVLPGSFEEGKHTTDTLLGDIPHRLYVSTVTGSDQKKWIVLAALEITKEVRYEKFAKLLLDASDQTDESIMISDARLDLPCPKILYVNRGFERMTGYNLDEIAGKSPRILQGPKTDRGVIAKLREKLENRERFEGETWIYRKGGEPLLLHWTIDPIVNNSGEITHFISVQRDVTSERERENRLQQSLREREVLLAEIHHRVKNNLALVSALLFLQLERTENRDAFEALSDSANRIHAMALIHEILYQSDNFARVPIPVFMERLSEKVIQTFTDRNQKIHLHQHIDEDLMINIDQAIPVGLIINELINNSINHAFCGLKKGAITINLNSDTTHFRLYYRDDGHGIPEQMNLEEDHRLGFQLIKALVRQLNGDYSFSESQSGDNRKGFEFQLYFPIGS